MEIISNELNKMGLACRSFEVLQDKDGIIVARVEQAGQSAVLKCFREDAYKREILNYRLLSSLGIPTIRLIASTDNAVLLEDVDGSLHYRLGVRTDMCDKEIARCIAIWYRQLHTQGYDYVQQRGKSMYDESNCITLENIAFIKEKTGTQGAPAWRLLERNFQTICTLLQNTRRTLTYNDFYYTNMVVARDKSSALMLDYNLLGKGYAYSDLRNVTSSLSEEAGKEFLEEYGSFDPAEKMLDAVVSVVVTLYLACRRKVFPSWAQDLLDGINTTFCEKIEQLLDQRM